MIAVGRVGMVERVSITVEDRIRQEMGDLLSLEENMKDTGLIQPLAVKDNGDGTYRLLAGGRRYLVLEKNNVQLIPVRIFEGDLSPLQMKVIEKSENFFRKDMEWFELDQLTAEIHSMQQTIHGVAAPGPGSIGWTGQDTADMIGQKSPQAVYDAIKRHEAREAFPELFDGCKTASDASKVLKKIDVAIVKQKIAQDIEANKVESNVTQLAKCFIVRSCFEAIPDIPNEVIHFIEIDPPYAVGLMDQKKKEGESQYVTDDYNEIGDSDYMNGSMDGKWKGMNYLFQECYRVMAPHSWLVCWFGPEPWFEEIYRAIKKAGFGSTRLCGIWTKGGPGQNMNPSIRLSNSYEMFFYAWKGNPALNKPGRSNNFEFPPVPAQSKTHPTERPVELMKEIYDTFAFAGSRVLIPFLGSGNGILAANQLGMSAFGFELSKAYKDSFLVKAHLMSGAK